MKSKWVDFQSCLAERIKEFLEYKRALGRRFWTEENALRLLDRYLAEKGITSIPEITPELLDMFLASRPRKQPRSYNHLVSVVSRLFDWLIGQGVLPSSPLHVKRRRETTQRIPFIFDNIQARSLLEVANRLPDNSRGLMRGITYKTIFALLYGLGLRVGEVSHLCWKEVDFIRHLLVIHQTKFAKSRLVPFGPRVEKQLQDYRICREHCWGPVCLEDPLFSFTKGKPVHPTTITQTFHNLLPLLELNIPSGVASPCLHSLRHSFAVRTLLRWYRLGINPTKRLIHLSTFLGHVDPASTAVYLTITADLFREASHRFEQYADPSIEEAKK